MINNIYFLFAENITPELVSKLKNQYQRKSHHKIKRMELNTISNQWGEKISELFAWL